LPFTPFKNTFAAKPQFDDEYRGTRIIYVISANRGVSRLFPHGFEMIGEMMDTGRTIMISRVGLVP
jgi:hypothetical protein